MKNGYSSRISLGKAIHLISPLFVSGDQGFNLSYYLLTFTSEKARRIKTGSSPAVLRTHEFVQRDQGQFDFLKFSLVPRRCHEVLKKQVPPTWNKASFLNDFFT